MKRDPRVNIGYANIRNYIALYLGIALLCGVHTALILLQRENEAMPVTARVIAQMTFLNLIAIGILVLFECFHRHYYAKPMRLLKNAAKQVADGDFSVRIPPQRQDGRRDEFEVIYEDFNAMVAELASVELLKRDFVSNVSHELKSPLAVIQTYATTLQSEELTDRERQEYAGKIADASRRLSVLVSNILQMSRLENQKIVPKLRPFNLSEQICRCALGFEAVWTEKQINVEIDLDQNITLNSDEELLDIVWNNLIANALKFTEPGGRVQISAELSEAQIVIAVRDSGCGIAPEAVKRIFDKFYQEDTSHAMEGNGLGLALVKQIVVLLGGTITVDSTQGVGSLFTVRLDRALLYQKPAE